MITIVSPWYGPDTRGGAENQARSLARALRALGAPVQVWTSTGRDSFDPGEGGLPAGTRPHYPPGAGEVDGVPIWRFRPSPTGRDGVPAFFRGGPSLPVDPARFAEHELRLLSTLLSSDELYAAILAERERSRFVFIPYPFPTTFWGGLLAPERSYLLPCLHDEPYARYGTYRYLFGQVRGMLANSPAEAELARRLYNLPPERICVAGEGIDLTPRGDAARFYKRLQDGKIGDVHASSPTSPSPNLLLYVGRREESKNIWLLLAYLREYWARRGTPLLLLMAGPGQPDLRYTMADPGVVPFRGSSSGIHQDASRRDLPRRPLWNLGVADLGFLDDQTKHDAYAAADLFVQPSLHESFSIVLMEAWLQGTPALVHAGCAVTADHARRSGGGLAFRDFGEFAAALDLLLPDAPLRRALGERGRAYVLDTCRWEEVARRTAEFVT